jgi:hypothetical protein
MWSLDSPDVARGRKYARAVIDETAMVVGLQAAWQHVIRATLTDYEGDAWFLSTPRGLNFFKQMFDWGQDPLMSDWMSWQMPTAANPFISKDEIEKARLELPAQTFAQEYLAEFIRNEGVVFRNVEANLIAPATMSQEHLGHKIYAGVDWAQKFDFTAISIGCATCGQEIYLDRFNKIEWSFQRARLKSLFNLWQVVDSLIEVNSIGSPNFEALANEGLPVRAFETTALSKPPLIQSLALALEREEFQFLPDAVAKNELLAYESKRSTVTGRISYSAPEGQHDDTVIARALMWESISRAARLPPPRATRSYSGVRSR